MERVVLFGIFMVLAQMGFAQQKATIGGPLDADQTEIKVFPNPATDYFQITQLEGAKKVVVRNMVAPVKTFVYSSTSQYDITDLPAGMHIILVMDENDKILKRLRLQVGGYRP